MYRHRQHETQYITYILLKSTTRNR